MKKTPVWIDCAAGIDDYAAIAFAHSLKEIEIAGISAVYGKSELENAYAGCLAIVSALGADYPVCRGAEKPLLKSLEICEKDAFDGCVLSENLTCTKESAWDALYHCAKEHPGQLRLICLGPLTNIGAAFMKYPELAELLHSVSVKGGAAIFGDVTPAAEFNIYSDPHSADIVFRAGAKLNVLFREATAPIRLLPDELSELENVGNARLNTLCTHLRSALARAGETDAPGAAVGCVCPVMYLIHPEFFTVDEVGVMVETRGSITNGRTVTDAYSDRQFPFKNAVAALGSDRDAILRAFKETLREL